MGNKQNSRAKVNIDNSSMKDNGTSLKSRRDRNIILALAIIAAIQMTSFGVIMPIFARRFADFGEGLEALGLAAMAYALTGIAAAPFVGSLADRFGRRPLLLVSLAAYGAAFTGYLFAASTEAFFAIRAFAGAFTAGLTPAMMGIVADISPENERAQWIGVVGSGSSVGWILGPAIGGMLFDKWGYAAPFTVSVLMAVIALGVAFFMVPETGTHIARRRIKSMRQIPATGNEQPTSIWHALPRPLSTFAVLLAITFIMIFSWAFTEPQLTVTIYEELGWTSARFGLLISGYGVAAFLGQMVLSRSSDRFGRLPIIMLGLLMHSAQYMGMMLTASFQLIMVSFVLAGLGEALLLPTMRAYFLDMTPQQHKSRIIGIKGSIGSLGSVIGPLLAVVASRSLAPQSVFLVSAVLLVLAALLILFTIGKRDLAAIMAVPASCGTKRARRTSNC